MVDSKKKNLKSNFYTTFPSLKQPHKINQQDPKWNYTTEKFSSLIFTMTQNTQFLNQYLTKDKPTNLTPTLSYSVKTTYIRLSSFSTYTRNFFDIVYTLAK